MASLCLPEGQGGPHSLPAVLERPDLGGQLLAGLPQVMLDTGSLSHFPLPFLCHLNQNMLMHCAHLLSSGMGSSQNPQSLHHSLLVDGHKNRHGQACVLLAAKQNGHGVRVRPWPQASEVRRTYCTSGALQELTRRSDASGEIADVGRKIGDAVLHIPHSGTKSVKNITCGGVMSMVRA